MKSIVTEYTQYCAFCGKPTNGTLHHLCFGLSARELSDKDGLTIGICDKCHAEIHVSSSVAAKMSKMIGQLAFEKKCVEGGMTSGEARDYFMKRYGISYL